MDLIYYYYYYWQLSLSWPQVNPVCCTPSGTVSVCLWTRDLYLGLLVQLVLGWDRIPLQVGSLFLSAISLLVVLWAFSLFSGPLQVLCGLVCPDEGAWGDPRKTSAFYWWSPSTLCMWPWLSVAHWISSWATGCWRLFLAICAENCWCGLLGLQWLTIVRRCTWRYSGQKRWNIQFSSDLGYLYVSRCGPTSSLLPLQLPF